MNFVNPSFLWSLLLLIPLAAIYPLKVRPVRKPTTAWFLWEDILKQRKATSLFQRLRDLFSLLLMAAAFAAIVFAMARPNFSGDQQRDLILLVDNSASMSASDGNRTRLEEAKAAATEIIQGLGGAQRCSVGTISNRLHFLANLSDNPKELLLGVEEVEPTSLVGDASLLAELVGKKSPTATASPEESGASETCLLYTSPSPRDQRGSRMPSSA